MKETYNIVIAEDHTILREGLRSLLSSNDQYNIIGEAGDGIEVIQCARDLKPDLILLDLNMPVMNGLAAIKEIKREQPETKILALTVYKNEEYIIEAFQSGVNGYCLKDATYAELKIAIENVLSGNVYISPGISDMVMEGFLLQGQQKTKRDSSRDNLTKREREILKVVAEGYKNKEISDFFSISVKTVEKHRSNIMNKLNLHSVSELTTYAIEKNIIDTSFLNDQAI